jgi:dipeptidyl aminopeptidase/acylaminoacyl peptidase
MIHREKNLDKNTMLLLGGRDDMVPATELYEYMQTNYSDVNIHYFPDDKHGKFSSRNNRHYHRVINEFLQP